MEEYKIFIGIVENYIENFLRVADFSNLEKNEGIKEIRQQRVTSLAFVSRCVHNPPPSSCVREKKKNTNNAFSREVIIHMCMWHVFSDYLVSYLLYAASFKNRNTICTDTCLTILFKLHVILYITEQLNIYLSGYTHLYKLFH